MVSNAVKDIVISWWENLQDDNGGRAQLRRCNSPEDVALHSQTHCLKAMLPAWVSYELVSTIVGLCSHIKSRRDQNFAESLAAPKEKGGKAPLSETRFRQLMQSRNWDELFRNLRRAINVLDDSINIESLIDAIFLWNDEFRDENIRPGRGLKFELSRAYYETAIKYE